MDDFEFDDFEFDQDLSLDMSDFEDQDLDYGIEDAELSVIDARSRWKRKEEERLAIEKELKEKEKKKKKEEGTNEEEVAQIFSSEAAFAMLSNELEKTIRNANDIGYDAYAIEDSVYSWRVQLKEFSTPDLVEQLTSLKELYGYDFIELDMIFKQDLYPFYPPLVQIIRPRLQGFMMGRITGMDILKLENWNPLKNMQDIIRLIQELIDKSSQIDFSHEMNDIEKFPQGAYTKLEHLLLELETLSDEQPRSKKKYPPSEEELEQIRLKKESDRLKKESETDSKKKTYWAKGTGFGFDDYNYYGDPVDDWDPDAYVAAQVEKDKQLQKVITQIIEYVEEKFDDLPDEGQSLMTVVLEESNFIPTVERYLDNDSLLDMNRHKDIYTVLFNCVTSLAGNKYLKFLLKKLPEQRTSLEDLMKKLKKSAELFLKSVGDNVDDDDLVHAILIAAVSVDSCLEDLPEETPLFMLGWNINNEIEEETKKSLAQNKSEEYCLAMAPFQFDTFDHSTLNYHHKYMTDSNNSSSRSKERIMRIAQEAGAIANSLPLNISSSIFLKCDEERLDIMSCMIVGPEDTPYSGGCFIFDIFFGDEYPDSPMKVWLMTTGNGSVRFNPNLYDSGKVCLSILGTWSGNIGESWNRDTSTLLQVLVSIQSLIMVPDPYFNEPGYEHDIGTPTGDRLSLDYNRTIVQGTVRWAMIEQLRNPKPGYKEIIHTHFKLQRERILSIVQAWKKHYTNLESLYNELVVELDKLEE